MGFCKRRHLFLTLCVLQLVTVVERQVFDFLGFLWISLLVNFLQIIFVIFGFFGAYQYRPKYIISYLFWQLAWIAWNIFLICLYLNVAGLDHETNKVLKLDYKSDSWWKRNGPGCKVVNVEESKYDGCLIDYVHIEVFQSGLQLVLTVFSCIIGTCLSRTFLEEDDTCKYSFFILKLVQTNRLLISLVDLIRKLFASHKSTRKTSKQSMSLYSIEFSSQMDRQGDSDNDLDQSPSSPKPMTPRRVKRRSVMQRGSSGRHSTSSRRQSHPRSSTRSSRRMQNPVTKLLEQQQKCQAYESSTISPVESPIHHGYYGNPVQMGHTNPSYQQSTTSLNEDFEDLYNNRPPSVRSSYSNFHGARANYSPTKQYQQHHQHSHATPQVPQKRSNLRSSMRNMAFMNNGPPAYTVQVDNETPM